MGLDLAKSCSTPYSSTIIKEQRNEEKAYSIHFGFVPVRLPEVPDRKLWLVVVKGFGNKPLMLLTTEPMRRNRKVLWWIVKAYITRWRVEDTIRFIKQSYDIEDIRVLTYDRLRNIGCSRFGSILLCCGMAGNECKVECSCHACDECQPSGYLEYLIFVITL